MTTASPARLYALLVGAVLVIAGIVGFAYSSSFGSPGEVDAVFGIPDVNAWHNIVHIATGLLGLALFRIAAREYALGLGAVYLVVADLGFIIGAMVTAAIAGSPAPARRARAAAQHLLDAAGVRSTA